MIKGFGIPLSIYSDRHTIFFSPKNAKLSIEEELEGKTEPYTQFSAAMSELGINMISAETPQAKGRIERLWETLQDRLLQEFILNGIKDIDSANDFMKKYIVRFNKRFSVTPKGEPLFRKLDKKINIDYILCSKYPRKLDSGSAFSYKGKYYQLIYGGKPAATIPRSRIKVMVSQKIGIKAQYSGRVYSLARIEKPTSKSLVKVGNDKKISVKPAANHPWRSASLHKFKYDPINKELNEGLYNSTIAWEADSY